MTFKCMYIGVKQQREPLIALQETPMAYTVEDGKFLENNRIEKGINNDLSLYAENDRTIDKVELVKIRYRTHIF